jgi:hypothetical protein
LIFMGEKNLASTCSALPEPLRDRLLGPVVLCRWSSNCFAG